MTQPLGVSGLNPSLPPLPKPSLSLPAVPTGEQGGGADFRQMLLNSLNGTSQMQHTADQLVQQGLANGDVSQVETLTSIKKAELSLKMMLQIRNKLMDAYTEIKQMQM